jgi:hypothetical protein
MSNSKDNVITRNLHGKFGNQVVFKTRNGKSISANVPKTTKAAPVASQIATRDRFRKAVIWAKNALADPVQLAAYQAAATDGKSAFVVAVTDFLKPPRISEVDCSAYKGHVGDKIIVFAIDDFKVKEAGVKICNPSGTVIESGTCQPDVSGQNWQYTATTEVPSLSGMVITGIATDNPGHSVELSVPLQ